MKKLMILLLLICVFSPMVSANEFIAPNAPPDVEKYVPDSPGSFAADLWYVFKAATGDLQPHIKDAAGTCVCLIAVSLLISILHNLPSAGGQVTSLVSAIVVSLLLIQPANSMIALGVETVESLSQYGKLLLPVMSSAMAAQGAVTTSAALYTGTAIFIAILTAAIKDVIVPLVYIYLVLSLAHSAVENEMLINLRSFIKWLLTWSLKIAIYLFTGYLGITGVISGTADAAAIKATKLAFSGLVPIVGKVISDASETVLVSAGVMKNAVGNYGMLAIAAIYISPFLQIGMQYLMLKITASVCSIFGNKNSVGLIKDFTTTLGYLLAATGTVCILLLVSTVCFMKGVS